MSYANNRPDKNERVSWEPLSEYIVRTLFDDPVLRFKIFKNYRGGDGHKIKWNNDYGFFSYDGSSKIQILVVRRDHQAQLKNLVDEFLLRRNGATEKTPTTGEAIVFMQDTFSEKFSRLVTLGSMPCDNIGQFIEDHWGVNGLSPNYTIEGSTGTDSGGTSGIVLTSVVSSNGRVNANALDAETVTDSNARVRFLLSEPGGVVGGRAMASAFLDVDNDDSDEAPVRNPYTPPSKANKASEHIYKEEGKPVKTYASEDSKTAPVSEVGGDDMKVITRGEFNAQSAKNMAYTAEGTIDSPFADKPSAAFFPNSNVIKNIFSPLSSVVDNPYLMIGLIALASLDDNDSDSHTVNYINLPQKVTDNQQIKDDLLGE